MFKKNKTVLKCFLVTAGLCIGLYYTLTCSFTLRLILEPVLSQVFKFPLSVEKVNYSPFTSILKFENVKLGYANAPFAEGKKGTCKLESLSGLLLGKVNFTNINLDGVTFRSVKFVNGKWNFPWMNNLNRHHFTQPPVSLNLSNINIKHGKVILEIKRKKPKSSSKYTLFNLNVNSPLFGSNHQTKINYNGLIKVSSGKRVEIKTGKISGSILSYFNEWIIPTSLVSNFSLKEPDGNINNLTIKNNKVDILTNIYTENEILKIKKISFREIHNNKQTTDISVAGFFNTSSNKGHLKIKAIPVSNEVLNVFSGVFANYNFGDMKLYYDGNINFDKKKLTNQGKIIINDFQINKNAKKSNIQKIPYDISLDYVLNYIYKDTTLYLKKLNSFFSKNLVDQKDRFNFKQPVKALTLSINNPIRISLKNSSLNIVGKKSKGKIVLNNLDIRFLNSVLVGLPKVDLFSGNCNGTFGFEVNPQYNDLIFKGRFNTDKLSFRVGNYSHDNMHIVQDFKCTLQNFKKIKINPFTIRIMTKTENILACILTGNVDLYEKAVNLKITLPIIRDDIINYLPEQIKNNYILNAIIKQLKPFYISAYTNIKLNLRKKNGSIGNAKLKLIREKYKNTTIELINYISFVWNSDTIKFPKNIAAKVYLKNLYLSLLNIFIPKEKNFAFTKGAINSSANCLFNKHKSNVKIDGKINMPSFGIKYNNNPIDDITFNALYNFDIDTKNHKLLFNNTNILDLNRINALSLESFGSYDIDKKFLTLNGNIFNLNKNVFSFFPAVNISGLNRLNASGNFKLQMKKKTSNLAGLLEFNKMSYFSQKTKTDITPFDSGTATFNLSNNDKITKINNLFLNFKKDNTPIFDLNVIGVVPTPITSAKTTFDITSQKLYPNFIGEMISAFSKNDKLKKVKSSPKPTTNKITLNNNLKNIDINAKINIKNIILDSKTSGKISAVANLKNSKLKVSQISADVNKSQLNGSFVLNLTHNGIYPYAFNVHCVKIPLADFLSLLNIKNNNIKGEITNLLMNFVGIDLPFSISKYKTLKGYLTADANNITLPIDLTRYAIFKIMFIPLELLLRFREMIPAGFTSANIKNAFTATSKIFSKIQQIDFKKANIYITADNNIKLKKVNFYGSQEDLIRLMKFSGKIYLNKKIDINIFSNISGLQFPIQINGTLDKPETNSQKFIYDFMKDNTINILDPQNFIDIIKDTGKGVEKTWNGTMDYVESD
jgi:hypothetical protein